MRIPWLRVLNALIYGADFVRGTRPGVREDSAARGGAPRGAWWVEQEQKRMDFERERMEAERQRAERARRLDVIRQTGDREISRLRLMAGVATVSLIGALVFFGQVVSTLFAALRFGTRVTMVGGWIFLVAAVVLSYSGQGRVAASLAHLDEPEGRPSPAAGLTGRLVPWFIAIGLTLVGLAAFTI